MNIFKRKQSIDFKIFPDSLRKFFHFDFMYSTSLQITQAVLSDSMMVWWPFSVSALPFDHTMFLFPPSIHATSILLVTPLAEWQLI